MIIRPNGAPAKREIQTLSREEVRRVVEFEAWLTSRGLSFDIYCNKCADAAGPKGARCWGNNSRDDNTYKLECQHAERVYGRASSPGREIVTPSFEKKIQVMVP